MKEVLLILIFVQVTTCCFILSDIQKEVKAIKEIQLQQIDSTKITTQK